MLRIRFAQDDGFLKRESFAEALVLVFVAGLWLPGAELYLVIVFPAGSR
jgi:hypothetical protein